VVNDTHTRRRRRRIKCTKLDFDSRGSAPDPTGGAYSAPLAGFKGPTSKGREWRGGGAGRKGKGVEEREGDVRFFP